MQGILLDDLSLRFFLLPFLSESCLGLCSVRRSQRAGHCFWKCFPLPHDISGLYCNFPHGCPDTGCCVYENPLDTSAEPPWRWRLCAGWAGLCVADKGSWEGQLLRRHLRRCELSSHSTGASAYLPQFQTVKRLGPLLLTAGDSRLGVRTSVWPVL